MFYNVGSGSLTEFAHLSLRKPQRLVFEFNVYLYLSVTGGVYMMKMYGCFVLFLIIVGILFSAV